MAYINEQIVVELHPAPDIPSNDDREKRKYGYQNRKWQFYEPMLWRLLKIILGDKVITSVFNLRLVAPKIHFKVRFPFNVRAFFSFFRLFLFIFSPLLMVCCYFVILHGRRLIRF